MALSLVVPLALLRYSGQKHIDCTATNGYFNCFEPPAEVLMQFACPVVVEYVPEDVRVPVEEVLFAVLVVEKLPLIRT